MNWSSGLVNKLALQATHTSTTRMGIIPWKAEHSPPAGRNTIIGSTLLNNHFLS